MTRSLPPLVLVLFLAGCQTQSGMREPVWPYPQPPTAPVERPRPAEPESAPLPAPVILPPPETGTPAALPSPELDRWPRSAAAVSGPAVQALLEQAAQARRGGRPDDAAASLERAVRIEPRNAFVWSELAAVYIDQGNYDQAEAIAQRANSLARGNPYVEIANWTVIAAARSGRGDALGSLQARARAEELQQGLPRE